MFRSDVWHCGSPNTTAGRTRHVMQVCMLCGRAGRLWQAALLARMMTVGNAGALLLQSDLASDRRTLHSAGRGIATAGTDV